jgi:pseudouridine synthase
MRINKFLAKGGLGSRRKVEHLVSSGKITVNGRVTRDLATQIGPDDVVFFEKKQVSYDPKPLYYAVHKPIGYVSTVSDPYASKTVMDLIGRKTGFFPVGRLDKNSRGLIIITNDGNFAQKTSHPSNYCEKEYRVRVRLPKKDVTAYVDKALRYFKCGAIIDGQKTLPAKIKLLAMERGQAIFGIILTEGRKRQIRRIFEKADMEVIDLLRVRIGSVELGDLKCGEVKQLHFPLDN